MLVTSCIIAAILQLYIAMVITASTSMIDSQTTSVQSGYINYYYWYLLPSRHLRSVDNFIAKTKYTEVIRNQQKVLPHIRGLGFSRKFFGILEKGNKS